MMAAAVPEYFDSFEAWLKETQDLALESLPADVLPLWKSNYLDAREAALAHDVHATVGGPHRHGHPRYAVAIEDGDNLWLTLWVKRSPNGECFVLWPRGPGKRNPHASYHRDGRYHQKSYNQKIVVQQRQPLDHFRGAEHLGSFGGHGPGSAVCRPEAFTSVIRVPKGILAGTRGSVLVDLVEPGQAPAAHHREVPGMRVVSEHVFKDCEPWVVITVVEQTA